jgi:hypothetical protein
MRRSIQFSLSTRHMVHSAINIAARRRSLKKKKIRRYKLLLPFFFANPTLPSRSVFYLSRLLHLLFFICVYLLSVLNQGKSLALSVVEFLSSS